MKKRTLITLGVIVLAGLAALSWLRSYQLELIHIVVTNAVVQKAPADYPEERIRLGFEQALNQVGHTGRETYLERLLLLSQRLEKLQELSTGEIDTLLEALAAPASDEKWVWW